MGNSRSSMKLTEENIKDISEETGFSSDQIDRLYSRFTNLDQLHKGYLTRQDFLRIPELAINPLGERIAHAFFKEHKYRAHGSSTQDPGSAPEGLEVVYFFDFVRVLAHFRPIKKTAEKNKTNTRMDKLKFAFRMYDLDDDDLISKDELLAVLTMMVGANISTEQLASIAERTVIEADLDHDNFISFEEFCKVLERIDVEQKMSIRFLS